MDQDMLNKRFVIYGLENKLNHKIYIGQTTNTLKNRIAGHKNARKSLIGQAIREHGIENFWIVVLEECETLKALNIREVFWIKTLNCMVPNGYNKRKGGSYCSPLFQTEPQRSVVCIELNKIFPSLKAAADWANTSTSNIGHSCLYGTKAKRYHWSYSDRLEQYKIRQPKPICWTDELRKKISESQSIPVLCVETGIIYTSMKAAAKAIGAASNAISRACLYEQRTVKGYHWRRISKN